MRCTWLRSTLQLWGIWSRSLVSACPWWHQPPVASALRPQTSGTNLSRTEKPMALTSYWPLCQLSYTGVLVPTHAFVRCSWRFPLSTTGTPPPLLASSRLFLYAYLVIYYPPMLFKSPLSSCHLPLTPRPHIPEPTLITGPHIPEPTLTPGPHIPEPCRQSHRGGILRLDRLWPLRPQLLHRRCQPPDHVPFQPGLPRGAVHHHRLCRGRDLLLCLRDG